MRPVVAESLHGQRDRLTDMKLIFAFRNLANAPKTPQELETFPASVKHLGLRTAPSDLIQQPYPPPSTQTP